MKSKAYAEEFHMKKRAGLFAVIVMAVALVVGITGCKSGPSDEEVIREGVTTELDKIKNLDDDFLSSVDEGISSSYSDLGISAKDFMSAYLDGFDYQVGDITVDKDTATVHLTITCKSFNDILSAFTSEYTSAAISSESTDTDSLKKLAGETLLKVIPGVGSQPKEVNVTCEKDSDGNWSYASGVASKITSLLSGSDN